MGLSDEERLLQVFSHASSMRRALLTLRHIVSEERCLRAACAITDSWISSLDYITGLLIEELNTSELHWWRGSSEMSVVSLYSQEYSLGRRTIEPKHPFGSFAHFYFTNEGKKKLVNLARCWTEESYGFFEERQVVILAAFWEAFLCVDPILYAMNRYDDDLFSEAVRNKLRQLMGQMLLRRYALCTAYDETYSSSSSGDYEHIAMTEQALLCRWRLLRYELDRELRHRSETNTLDEPFDSTAFIIRIGKMSLLEVKAALEAIVEEKLSRRREQEKTAAKKELHYMVTPVADYEELKKIVESSMDREAVEKAAKELEVYYSSYDSSWRERFEKADNTKVKKKKNERKVE